MTEDARAGRADLGRLTTEEVRPELDDLDLLGAAALVSLMAADSLRATEAVVAAAPAITSAVSLVCQQLRAGGRLIYVGAGTAGRLAVLDAAELGPTFSVPDGVVEAVIAGGDVALRHAVEGAEDDRAGGAAAVGSLEPGQHDVVIGVSASGRTRTSWVPWIGRGRPAPPPSGCRATGRRPWPRPPTLPSRSSSEERSSPARAA